MTEEKTANTPAPRVSPCPYNKDGGAHTFALQEMHVYDGIMRLCTQCGLTHFMVRTYTDDGKRFSGFAWQHIPLEG